MPSSGPPLAADLNCRDLTPFVAWTDDDLAGVIAMTDRGDVAEWAVPYRDGARVVARALLETGEAWAREKGCAEINVLVPADDAVSRDALASLGYRSVEPPSATLRVLDFATLFEKLAAGPSFSPPPWSMTLQLLVRRSLSTDPFDEEFVIHLREGQLHIDRGAGSRAEARAETSAAPLTKFLFSLSSPSDCCDHYLRVEPPRHSANARQLLSRFRVPRPWFTPLGDRR
jgi:hypothetical protein